MSRPPSTGPTPMFKTFSVASVGLEMGLAVAVGGLLGAWLDGAFGTRPWLLLLFLGFGLAAGFKGMLRAAREVRREIDDDFAEAPAETAEEEREGSGEAPPETAERPAEEGGT